MTHSYLLICLTFCTLTLYYPDLPLQFLLPTDLHPVVLVCHAGPSTPLIIQMSHMYLVNSPTFCTITLYYHSLSPLFLLTSDLLSLLYWHAMLGQIQF